MNIEAKRAFVLADWMKAAQRCDSEEEFLSLLSSEKLRVTSLGEHELNQIIVRDTDRLNRFETLAWTLDRVSLGDCFVYDRMGARPWAVGTVKEVGEKFVRMEPSGSRIWKMKFFADIFSSQLPLIIIREEGKLKIDDGSHRAIAMYLSGINEGSAYIGGVQSRP